MDGSDSIVTGTGASMADGGDGDDIIQASGRGDTIIGGSGGDYVYLSENDRFLDAGPSDYVLGLQERIAQRRQNRIDAWEISAANSVRRDPIVPQSVSTSAPGISEFTLSSNVITEGESLYALLRTDGSGSWARMTIFVDTNGNGRYDSSTDQQLYRSRGRTSDYRGQLRTSSLSPGAYQVRALLEAYNGTTTLSSALTLSVLEEQVLPAPPALPDHLDIAEDEAVLIIPNRNGDVTVPGNELAGISQVDLYEYRVGTSGGHGISVDGLEGVIGLYNANGDLIDGPVEGTTLVTNLSAGETYYIAIAGRNGATGTYSLIITGRNQVTQGTIATPPGNYAGTGTGTFVSGASIHYWRVVAPVSASLLEVDVTSAAGNPLWVRIADEQNNVIGFADFGRPGSEHILRNLPVNSGQTYYITVHGLYELEGDYSVTADFYPDDVGFPTAILPTTALADYQPLIIQADGDYSLPNQQIASAGEFKYFHIAPSFSGDFIIRTTGSTDTLLGVYSGNGAQLLAQSDNDADSLNGQVQVSLTGGDEYWGLVRGVGDETGSFGVELIGPDQAVSVIPIGGLSNQGTDSFFVGVTSSRQEYFQFTAPVGTDTAFIQVEATDPENRPLDIVWFIEDSQGNITTIDSGGVNVAEILNSFAVNEGETYFITVTSKDRAPGSGRLTIDLGPDAVGAGEFVATTTFYDNQDQPRTAINANGQSVIVWTRDPAQGASNGDLDDDIYFQIFDTNGQPVGSETRANVDDDFVYQGNPDVGIASDGSFWIVWQDFDNSLTRVRKFNSFGTALTDEIDVGFSGAFQAEIAVHDDGTFAVIGSNSDQILFRSFSSTGTPSSSVLTVDDPAGNDDVLDPTLAILPGGGYVGAWTTEEFNYNIIAQRFDSTGTKVGGEISVAPAAVSQFNTQIETNASGQFAVAYRQNDDDGTGSNVYLQLFTASGIHVGTADRVHLVTSGNQEHPVLEVRDDGSVVVLWSSADQDGSGAGVYLRQFDRFGEAVTSMESLLNTFTSGDQERPTISTSGDDSFFVAWESDGQDGSVDSVVALRLTLPSPPPQPVISITESTGVTNDLIVPFGMVTQFSMSPTRVIRIENTGTAALTGQLTLAGADSAAYSYDGSNTLSLAPGTFRDVTVTMATNVRGPFNAQLVVDHNAIGDQVAVVLDGQVSPVPDGRELNNSDETASNLGTISSVNLGGMTLHTSTDVDWFRFSVATYSEVTVSTTFSHAEGDIDLFVYDRNLGIRALSASSTDNEQAVFILDGNEDAYVLIAGNGAVSNLYSLSVEAVAEPRPEVHLLESVGTTEVSEDGMTDTYSVVLNAAPDADVQIEVIPDNQIDLGSGRGNPISLIFTPMNWDIPQNVIVSAPNDGDVEGAHSGLISHLVVSGDGRYDGYEISNVTVDIVDANLPSNVSLSNTVTTLSENAITTPRIKVADIIVNDDGIGTRRLSLSGSDAALFEIDGTELFLIAGAMLDFEANPSLDVTVQVDDTTVGMTPDDTAPLSITITDVNEPPTVALQNTTTTFAEDFDTTTRTKVADIVVTDDALGTNVLSLTGADASLFEIDATELFLIAGAMLDFESNPALDVTVEVDDTTLGSTPDDTALLTISVTDVNENGPTTRIDITPSSLGYGIPGQDNATGNGFILYSQQSVQQRFAGAIIANGAEHFVAVRYINSQWQYAHNDVWVDFTPTTGDRLIAAINFDSSQVQMLLGSSGSVNGINQGYVESDLTITPNQWRDRPNAGEFGISGTYFTVEQTITRVDIAPSSLGYG
ncbi:MAG TPA: hypothetical protein DD473_13795, partial [Planctomycetaceae bacterium]|nr:hypothetical protein [Planctomycetaceae bacterium]